MTKLDIEHAIIGAVIIDNRRVFEVPIDTTYFSDTGADAMTRLMDAIHAATPVDVIVATGLLKGIYTASQVSEIASKGRDCSNFGYSVKMVYDLYERETLNAMAKNVLEQNADGVEVEIVRDNAESAMVRREKESIKTCGDLAMKHLEIIDGYRKHGNQKLIKTGIRNLDQLIGGFGSGDFAVIGARPSIGKTSFAMSIMRLMAENLIPSGFFSVEMPEEAVMMRWYCMVSGVDYARIKTGMIGNKDAEYLTDAAAWISASKIYVDFTKMIGIAKLKSIARQWASRGCKIIFVDYLTLVQAGSTFDGMYERVGHIANSLKALAAELKIPVIALAQLKRDAENKRPSLADLKESSMIEDIADVVGLLHRERGANTAIVDVRKHRNGPIGEVEVYFDEKRMMFRGTA